MDRNGCEVEGLEGRLDRGANLFSSYKAMYVIVLLINVNRRWSYALLVSLYLIKGNLNNKRNDGLAENEINEKVDASPVTQKI